MNEPSIKGAAITGTVDLVRQLVAEGHLSADEIEVRLEAGDLALLDEKIEPTLWYPIASVGRLGDLVVQTLGEGDLEVMVSLGEETARRFQQEGVFAAFIREAAQRGERVGEVLVNLSELTFDFGRWNFDGDALEAFTVWMTDAEPLPEPTRHSILGFIRELASSLAGVDIRVESHRPRPGVVIYRGRRAAS